MGLINVTAEINEMEGTMSNHPHTTNDGHELKYMHILYSGVVLLVFVCMTTFILTIVLGLRNRKSKTRVSPLYVDVDRTNGTNSVIHDANDLESIDPPPTVT